MRTAQVKSHTDSWVEEDSEHANHGQGVKMRVGGAGGARKRSFLYFAKPFDHGVTINTATLYLYLRGGWGTSTTVRVRRITESWKENRINWANQPAAENDDSDEATYSFTGPGADGDRIAIDCTDIFTNAALTGDYHGLRIHVDATNGRSFYSSDSPKDQYCPRLVVEWGQQPYPPTNLKPSGGDAIDVAAPWLKWRFTDEAGDTQQSKSQVQIHTSSDFSGAVFYDSSGDGNVANPVGNPNTKHGWPTVGETSLTDNTNYWWRCRVRDDGGLWSGWSDIVKFQRQHKGTLTLVNPPVPPDNIVHDLTPPITWSLSGRTQDRVAMILSRVRPNGDLDVLQVESEQAVDPGYNSFTVQRGSLNSQDTFRVQLWVWDTIERADIHGDLSFSYAQRDFTYVRDGHPDPPTSLSAQNISDSPGVHLTWTRVEEPDYFCVKVDGREHPELQRIDPEDVRTGPQQYEMDYWFCQPNVSHTFEVEAVVQTGGDKLHSAGNPTDTITPNIKGKWMVDADDGVRVQFLDKDDVELTIGQSATIYNPIGSRKPVQIIDSIRGYEGSVQGILDEDARTSFEVLIGRMGRFRYFHGDLNIPVEITGASFSPSSENAGLYNGHMDFEQVDEFFHIEGSR